MKTKLEWQQVDSSEWWIRSVSINGKVYDHTGDPNFDIDERFEICLGHPDDDWEFFPCESLEAAKLEVERRIREAAMPLFADVIAERDALAAKVAELEYNGDPPSPGAMLIEPKLKGLPLEDEDLERLAEIENILYERTNYTWIEENNGDYLVDAALTIGRTVEARALCVVPAGFWGAYDKARKIARWPRDIVFLLDMMGKLGEALKGQEGQKERGDAEAPEGGES